MSRWVVPDQSSIRFRTGGVAETLRPDSLPSNRCAPEVRRSPRWEGKSPHQELVQGVAETLSSTSPAQLWSLYLRRPFGPNPGDRDRIVI